MSEGVWVDLIQDYAVYMVGISTVAGSLIAIYKKALKPMIEVISKLYSAIEKIDRIFEELTPNGGTSIKDQIDRMDKIIAISNERQKAIMADSDSAYFETDANGNCVWVNRTYTKITGLSLSQILGHGWQNAIAPQDREGVVNEWYKAVEENREFIMEYYFETPDGIRTKCKVRGYKMVSPKGELLGYWGHGHILK